MKLSVIIVNYKVPEYLHQCLLSLLQTSQLCLEHLDARLHVQNGMQFCHFASREMRQLNLDA